MREDADVTACLQSHGPCLFIAERSAALPCHLLAPALPAEEGWDVRQDPPPWAQAAPGKENFSSSLQVTKLAWLNSTSYPDMWLMVAQGPVQGQGRERMLAVVFLAALSSSRSLVVCLSVCRSVRPGMFVKK